MHRSRPRTSLEDWVRSSFPARYYRCHDCGWRGLRATPEELRRMVPRYAFWLALVALTWWLLTFL